MNTCNDKYLHIIKKNLAVRNLKKEKTKTHNEKKKMKKMNKENNKNNSIYLESHVICNKFIIN